MPRARVPFRLLWLKSVRVHLAISFTKNYYPSQYLRLTVLASPSYLRKQRLHTRSGKTKSKMATHYIQMEDEPLRPNPRLFEVKGTRRVYKPRIEPWCAMVAAIYPLVWLGELIHYTKHVHIYIPCQHLPLCAFLLLSIHGNPADSSPAVLLLSYGILACCVALSAGACIVAQNCTKNVLVTAGSTFGVCGITLALQLLLARYAIHHVTDLFVAGFFATSLISIPGLVVLVFFGLTIGLLLELVMRILICRLRPCVDPGPTFWSQQIPLEPVLFSAVGLECMEPIKGNEWVVATICEAKHVLHLNCVLQAATSFDCRGTCPICRNSHGDIMCD